MEEDHHQHHDTEREELQAQEGEETPMMKEKDVEESQMRVGKEDGMRDPQPTVKKTTMTPRMMNSSTCSLESWPMPSTTNKSPSGTPCHV